MDLAIVVTPKLVSSELLLVLYFRATSHIPVKDPPKEKEKKNSLRKKFLIFPEMELSSSNIKKITFSRNIAFLVFTQIKAFLKFPEMEPCTIQPKLEK